MKLPSEWNPAVLLDSPLFAPLQPVLAQLSATRFPELSDWNKLLSEDFRGIYVKNGKPLHFVPQAQGKSGFESQYEPRCYLTGEVQTRAENWHDLFNALVWLTFPKAKAAINNRHFQALSQNIKPEESQRGRVRDMATLLDESGVIVVCADAALGDMLCSFQWDTLFLQNREKVCAEMGFYIFGHGLYEKSLSPYVGMTGQGLVLRVSPDFFGLTLKAQLACLDELMANYIDDPEHCLSPLELHPVPLLGIPGWSADNENSAYYDNKSYFRTGRRNMSG